jgi:beta-galactosidase
VKRLSDEYIRFRVEGAGELVDGLDSEINPQRLLWGEAVALVRSGMEPGKITVRADVLKKSINGPDSAVITFETIAPNQPFIYKDLPSIGSEKEFVQKENSRQLQELQSELRAIKKQLLRHELNDVGRQQQEFIQ